jgi:Tfp pilus assembly protein FimT
MRRRTWRRGDREGYTLMEVLVGICIVGILCSLFAPDWSSYAARMRVRSASNQLVADLAYTRMLAAQAGRTTALVLEPSPDCSIRYRGRTTGHRYRVVSDADPDVALRTVDLRRDGGRVCMEMNGSGTRIAFNSRSLPREFMNRTVWVHEAAAVDSLTLSAVGRVLRR